MHINQIQQPAARITASIIVPTLAIDHELQVRWTMRANQKQTQSSAFRLARKTTTTNNSSTIISGTKTIERAASSSLPYLPLGQS